MTKQRDLIKVLISQALGSLCKNNLNFNSQITIDALIGVTIDQNEVILVSVKENITLPNENEKESATISSHNDFSSTILTSTKCKLNADSFYKSPLLKNKESNYSQQQQTVTCNNRSNDNVVLSSDNNNYFINNNNNNHKSKTSICPNYTSTSLPSSNDNDLALNLCNNNLINNYFDFSRNFEGDKQIENYFQNKNAITVIAPDTSEDNASNISSFNQNSSIVTNASAEKNNSTANQFIKKKNIFSRLILTDKLKARKNEFESNCLFEKINSRKRKLHLFSIRDSANASKNSHKSLASTSSLCYPRDLLSLLPDHHQQDNDIPQDSGHFAYRNSQHNYDPNKIKDKLLFNTDLNCIANNNYSNNNCPNSNKCNDDEDDKSFIQNVDKKNDKEEEVTDTIKDYSTVKIKIEPISSDSVGELNVGGENSNSSNRDETFNDGIESVENTSLTDNGTNNDNNNVSDDINDVNNDANTLDLQNMVKNGNDDEDDDGDDDSERMNENIITSIDMKKQTHHAINVINKNNKNIASLTMNTTNNNNNNNINNHNNNNNNKNFISTASSLNNILSAVYELDSSQISHLSGTFSKSPPVATQLPWNDFQNMLIKSWRRNHHEDMMIKAEALVLLQNWTNSSDMNYHRRMGECLQAILLYEGKYVPVRDIQRLRLSGMTSQEIRTTMEFLNSAREGKVGCYREIRGGIGVFYKCPPHFVDSNFLELFGLNLSIYDTRYNSHMVCNATNRHSAVYWYRIESSSPYLSTTTEIS